MPFRNAYDHQRDEMSQEPRDGDEDAGYHYIHVKHTQFRTDVLQIQVARAIVLRNRTWEHSHNGPYSSRTKSLPLSAEYRTIREHFITKPDEEVCSITTGWDPTAHACAFVGIKWQRCDLSLYLQRYAVSTTRHGPQPVNCRIVAVKDFSCSPQ